MKMCLKFTHPKAIQDVDEFVSSLEQIWKNLQLTSEFFAVDGCHQNKSPNSCLLLDFGQKY